MSSGEDIRGKAEGASSLPPFLTRRKYPGPGPEERRLRSRIIYKLTGRWPQSVVSERLAVAARMDIEARYEMDAWMKEQWLSSGVSGDQP